MKNNNAGSSVHLEKRTSESHQSAPHRCPGATQRGILAENCVHKPTDHTKCSTSHLEDAEDEHALLVENKIPVPVHAEYEAAVTSRYYPSAPVRGEL